MQKKLGPNETSKPKTKRALSAGNRPHTVLAQTRTDGAPSKTLPASGPRSLMKTAQLGAGRLAQRRPEAPSKARPAPSPVQRSKAPSIISDNRQQKIEERIAAAT